VEERGDRNVCALKHPLEEWCPKVLDSIGVYLTFDIFGGVVNRLVDVLLIESLIGEMRVSVQRGTRLNIPTNLRL
jgi:hypothetical protein